ncbi:MAG TPA: GTP-binding protein [Tepidisphaeraceae bacterium]|nr:GTP-binding protein [Tepidisphaeraceae bacterium]
MPDLKTKARYLMIGGFLGAGKTTAILRIAERLRDRGLKVGLITNDQSFGLVDTAMLSSHGFQVEEITGGCFCCKFNSLVDASDRLSTETRPDVFIAEPVGSCTDLKATVDYPLRRIYGNDFSVAPLSVMVDPIRASRILGLETGKSFSKKVVYIYRKQLEEAEIIVVNKTDLLSPDRLAALVVALKAEFPSAHVLPVSAREGSGIDEWICLMERNEPRTTGAMDVDYEVYAEGEALLGWLNSMIRVEAAGPTDGNAVLLDIASRVQASLHSHDVEIAHLKLTLTPDEGNDIAVANLVRNDGGPELSHMLQEPIEAGQLILNLRAEADPDLLRDVIIQTLKDIVWQNGFGLAIEHLESFRPGKPEPTHRMASV